MEARRGPAPDPAALRGSLETLLRQSARPAPEDSEFAVALTDVVVERRTFLKHPIIARVEKTSDGSRSSINLLLRNGQTIELPGTAIEKLGVASSLSILRAAGLEAPAQPRGRKPGASPQN